MFLEGNVFHGVVRYERMKSWAKFSQNAIVLYCPKRTTTRIGHLSSSTKNKQKTKKVSPSDRKFVVQQYIKSVLAHYDPNPWENLWSLSQKWNNSSTFTKTKGWWQHALVTCAKWALPRCAITTISRFANRYTFYGLTKTGKFWQTLKLIRIDT